MPVDHYFHDVSAVHTPSLLQTYHSQLGSGIVCFVFGIGTLQLFSYYCTSCSLDSRRVQPSDIAALLSAIRKDRICFGFCSTLIRVSPSTDMSNDSVVICQRGGSRSDASVNVRRDATLC